jgi:hypothetical protein
MILPYHANPRRMEFSERTGSDLRQGQASRLEQIDEQRSERVQDCKHRLKSCDDSAARGESGPNGIFGKDRSTRTATADRKPLKEASWQIGGAKSDHFLAGALEPNEPA